MDKTQKPRTFLQSLEAMASEAPEPGLTLRAIFERLDERAFGAGLFLLALPCAIPFLYIVPQVVSLPMMALTLQMLAGRGEPWLPAKFGQRKIDKAGLTRMSGFGRKWFGWLERIARPRLRSVSDGVQRLNPVADPEHQYDPRDWCGDCRIWSDVARWPAGPARAAGW